MTLEQLGQRARAVVSAISPGAAEALPRVVAAARWGWANRTLVLAAVVVVLVALNARSCRRASTAEGQLAAAAALATEQAKARPVSPVVEAVPQPVVDEEAKRILAAHPALVARVKELEARIGKVKPVLSVSGQTGVVQASGPERPGEPAAGAPSAAGAPPVLLRQGDGLRLTLDGLGVQGQAGSLSLLLDVGAVRVSDDADIGRAPLSVPLTTALLSELAPGVACPAATEGRRWHAGPVGGIAGGPGGGGWLAGAAGTYRVWKLNLLLTVGAGPGGAAALAGILF